MENRFELNDRTYTFGTIPPFEAIKVETAVVRVVGEPLFKAMMEPKKTGQTAEEAMAAGAAVVGLVTAKLDADTIIETMETVFKYVTVDGERANINKHFVGRNKELWQVFIAGLRFNFSDFLPEGLFASVQKAVTK